VSRPKITIIGSVDETRFFDLLVTDPVCVRRSCEQLGDELAEDGWDLVAYSGDRSSMDADLVRGYIESGKAVSASCTSVPFLGTQQSITLASAGHGTSTAFRRGWPRYYESWT
jgi:hypothetical protein